MVPNEVFLSHAGADQSRAADLAAVLGRHGVPIWYSQTTILGAQQWHDEIGAALHRCDWFARVLTPDAVNSMWVKRELMFALQQVRFENRIVPLLYRDCDVARLSRVLSSVQSIDFRQGSEHGYRTLLRLWGIGYQPG